MSKKQTIQFLNPACLFSILSLCFVIRNIRNRTSYSTIVIVERQVLPWHRIIIMTVIWTRDISSFNQSLCHFSKRKNLTYNNQRYAILVHLHRPYTEDLASFLYLFCVHWCWHIVKSKPKNGDTLSTVLTHTT